MQIIYVLGWGQKITIRLVNILSLLSNLTLKFVPSGRWDAPSSRPLAPR